MHLQPGLRSGPHWGAKLTVLPRSIAEFGGTIGENERKGVRRGRRSEEKRKGRGEKWSTEQKFWLTALVRGARRWRVFNIGA